MPRTGGTFEKDLDLKMLTTIADTVWLAGIDTDRPGPAAARGSRIVGIEKRIDQLDEFGRPLIAPLRHVR
jgi:hypothetical protein